MDWYQLNIRGPYVHGVWSDGGGVGNEESLSGRANLILESFYDYINRNFSRQEIKQLSFIDIGSYDGYLSHEISKKLNFKSITSLEPRIKNFQKGQFLRKELKIYDDVIYINSDLDSLIRRRKKFDIVFCVGVLHHISDVHSFITKLTKVTKRDLFLEFITYNEILKYIPIYKPFLKRKLTKINNTQVETKDIIYSQIPKLYGISAFKAESNYLDGSTIDTNIVTLPSYEHVQLSFKINNFDTNLIVDSDKYRKSLANNERKFNAVIISAQKASSNYSLETATIKHESYFLFNILSKWQIHLLMQILNNEIIKSVVNSFYIKCKKYIILNKIYHLFLFLIPKKDRLIWKNFIYNPIVKIQFEIAKFYFHKKDNKEAKFYLNEILQTPNSDWRACYRSLVLLLLSEDNPKRSRFLKDLKISNPNFPVELLTE